MSLVPFSKPSLAFETAGTFPPSADKSSQGEPSKREAWKKREPISVAGQKFIKVRCAGVLVALNGPRDIRNCIELTEPNRSVDISITSPAMIDRARESYREFDLGLKALAAACARSRPGKWPINKRPL